MNKSWYIYTPAEYKTTHLNFIDEVLGSTLFPLRLLSFGDLLMAGPVVPTLAPYVNMLATIMGTPLDFLHFVIRCRSSLLAFCATPSHGNRYHRTLTSVRRALLRGSHRWSQRWGPAFFNWSRGRDCVSLFCHAARGRSPCGSITACWGARPGSTTSRVLVGHLHRSSNSGLN